MIITLKIPKKLRRLVCKIFGHKGVSCDGSQYCFRCEGMFTHPLNEPCNCTIPGICDCKD